MRSYWKRQLREQGKDITLKRRGVYKRKDGRYEARYKKGIGENGRAIYGVVYGATAEEAAKKRSEIIGYEEDVEDIPAEMNLLILGAGTHGRDVKEIAESLHIFNKISFLDDKLKGDEIIGTCKNVLRFRKEYPCAFIAIGDNRIRKKYAKFLKDYKFLVPKIVSPAANISPSAKIGEGTAIMPQATVGDAEVGEFCILASNSLVNSGCKVKEFVHIDCGGIVLKGQKVPMGTVIDSGKIYSV